MADTYKDQLARKLRQVREAESRLEEAEDTYEKESHAECTLHNNNLRYGADELDEQVRHEIEITRLRAPLDAARAVLSDLINGYWRIYAKR